MPHKKDSCTSKQSNKKHGSSSKTTSSKHHIAKRQYIEETLAEDADHQSMQGSHNKNNLEDRIAVGTSLKLHAMYGTQFCKWSEKSIDFWTTVNTVPCDAPPLERWAYETQYTNITIAERFEKANWEPERLERL